ncbi:MAG: hypothetical protein WCG23_03070 [bacterium]
MNVSSIKNSNLAFGSFGVVVQNLQDENKTFGILKQSINESNPETRITLHKTKLFPGFNSEPRYSIYEVTGRNMEMEQRLLDTFKTSGLRVIPTEVSPETRAAEGLKNLTNAAKVQEEIVKLDINA